MTDDPLVEVTKLVSAAVSDVGDVHALPERRDEAVERLAAALRIRAHRRRRRRLVASCAVAASLLAVAGATMLTKRQNSTAGVHDLGHVSEGTGAVTVLRDGHPSALGANAVVSEGSELRTPPHAEARLDFANGTKVSIGGGTHLLLIEQSSHKRFALRTGSLSAKVAKLRPDERFIVVTNDSEVEVRGTEFRVTVTEPDPRCGGGTATRLEVSEGVVAIRHDGIETAVAAGERWPNCHVLTTAAPAAIHESPTEARTPDLPPRSKPPVGAVHAQPDHPVTASSVNPSAASALAAQNALYSRALRERQEGRSAVALASVDELIATYPDGPLLESAHLLRMRILTGSDRPRAVAAAREYLQRYPNGFGRTEASALVAEAQ